MNVDNGYLFWKRVDIVRGSQSLLEFGKIVGLNYSSLKTMRSRCQMPGIPVIIRISDLYKVSTDFLLKGQETNLDSELVYVRDNEAARLLIRKMMDNPPLVEALAAVAALSDKDNIKTKQA